MLMDVGRTALPNLKDPATVSRVMESMGEAATILGLLYKSAEKGAEGARP
jgi:hypothetical protein